MSDTVESVSKQKSSIWIVAWTIAALVAFAWNSTLCRLALLQTDIGPLTFTMLRLSAGAIVLALISLTIRRTNGHGTTDNSFSLKHWRANYLGAFWLWGYATCFSLAYVSLHSGLGALLLFGAVQFTMIWAGLFRGERLSLMQWLGFVLAVIGLLILLRPDSAAEESSVDQVPYILLMIFAGVCWGMYSLNAKGKGDPTKTTAMNFAKATLIALIVYPILVVTLFNGDAGFNGDAKWDWLGCGYAVISGAVTSGIGYAIWYHALKSLRSTVAATVQLSVPVLVAITGVLVLGERLSGAFVVSAALILGGVGLVIRFRKSA